MFELLRSSFSKLSNESEEIISFKCITLWSMVHGLVGIIRKVNVIGDINQNMGPMPFANEIANNIDDHLDKVISGIIKN